ncbi:hypothetical protein PSAC2689_70197 [Paraburkholderia sacchari]
MGTARTATGAFIASLDARLRPLDYAVQLPRTINRQEGKQTSQVFLSRSLRFVMVLLANANTF